jgi:hypothetical protein
VGDRDALAGADRELDGVEATLVLARGKVVHARFSPTGSRTLRNWSCSSGRREVGFPAGVAANLVGLAYLSDDPEAKHAYLDEAAELARSVGAAGVLRWVDDARQ